MIDFKLVLEGSSSMWYSLFGLSKSDLVYDGGNFIVYFLRAWENPIPGDTIDAVL